MGRPITVDPAERKRSKSLACDDRLWAEFVAAAKAATPPMSVSAWLCEAGEMRQRHDRELVAAFAAAHLRPSPLPDWAKADDGVPLKWKEPPR